MFFYTRCSKGNGLVKFLALRYSLLLQRISSLHMKGHMYLSPIVSSQRCCWALTSLLWIDSLATIDSCNALLNAKYEACQFSNVLLGWIFVITVSRQGQAVKSEPGLLCCAVSLDFKNLQWMVGGWVVVTKLWLLSGRGAASTCPLVSSPRQHLPLCEWTPLSFPILYSTSGILHSFIFRFGIFCSPFISVLNLSMCHYSVSSLTVWWKQQGGFSFLGGLIYLAQNPV